jgi:hypothetical protein
MIVVAVIIALIVVAIALAVRNLVLPHMAAEKARSERIMARQAKRDFELAKLRHLMRLAPKTSIRPSSWEMVT